MNMMQIDILRYEDMTPEVLQELRACARSAGSRLPFCLPEMPLIWWRNFSSSNGEPFGIRRGRNFLGAQCWLRDFFYLVAREGTRICGAAPMASFTVRLPNVQDPFKVFTFAGDYVLAPYQDFLALPEARGEVLSALISACVYLMGDGYDMVSFGHIPEESASIPVLDRLFEDLPPEIPRKRCITSQKGGVHPWTLATLQKLMLMLYYKVAVDQPEYKPVYELSCRLRQCRPDSLLFPRNRMELEAGLQALVAAHAHVDGIRDEVQSIHRLLGTNPIQYPFIELPREREGYLQQLGKKTRFNYRHDRKRLLGSGGGVEKISSGGVTEADVMDYLNLHMMRWGKRSVAISDRTVEFHRQLCMAAAREGYLTLFFIRWCGKRIAAQSCFDIGDRREAYFTGLDPDHEQSGAGIVLFHETILDAIDNGFTRYEFGYGGDEYKFKFTRTTSKTYSYFLAGRKGMPDLEKIFLGFECMVECPGRARIMEEEDGEEAGL